MLGRNLGCSSVIPSKRSVVTPEEHHDGKTTMTSELRSDRQKNEQNDNNNDSVEVRMPGLRSNQNKNTITLESNPRSNKSNQKGKKVVNKGDLKDNICEC
jgi:hypothetical protein